jgi:serine/threonine protein kinase
MATASRTLLADTATTNPEPVFVSAADDSNEDSQWSHLAVGTFATLLDEAQYMNYLIGNPEATEQQEDGSEPPTRPALDGIWDWADRGASHVEFAKEESLPLQEGRFLGYGVSGGVYETEINGTRVAWKRKYCRSKIGIKERQEIEIIKRLRHEHIIKLVGTYTHRSFLGLLLWPVATTDLGTYLEDINVLLTITRDTNYDASTDKSLIKVVGDRDDDILERLEALGFPSSSDTVDVSLQLIGRLTEMFACITNAIVYLHHMSIRHKDLKPSNILVSKDGLWIIDFGTATDFAGQTRSTLTGGDRGTPKYFAPEVAAYEPNGRAADIFSLGCIFLEMCATNIGVSRERTLRMSVKTKIAPSKRI